MPTPFRCNQCGNALSFSPQADAPQFCPVCAAPVTVPAQAGGENAWWVNDPTSSASTAGDWGGAAPAVPPEAVTAAPPPLPGAPPLPQLKPGAEPCCPAQKVAVAVAVTGTLALALVGIAVAVAVLALPSRPGEEGQDRAIAALPETPSSEEQPRTIETSRDVLPEPPPARPETAMPTPPSLTPPAGAPKIEIKPVDRPKIEEKPPVRVEEKKPVEAKLVVKRRRDTTEDDLRKQIEKAPEIALYKTFPQSEAKRLAAQAAARAGKPAHETKPSRILARDDLAGLPLRMGDACKLSPTAADHLQGGSVGLGAHLAFARTSVMGGLGNPFRSATAVDARPDPKILHERLLADKEKHNKWLKTEAIPVMQQMLMAENEAVREVLVDQLSRIDGPAASVALAQRALFDLHPRVRQSALEMLRKRPVKEYQQVLLDGFHYPWPAAADHAAEAVVALQFKDAVPTLLAFLDRPEPTTPFEKPGKGMHVREMIKINHLRNCMLCHPQSMSAEDKVRGRVPPTDQPLNAGGGGYGGRQGTFVRADVTYLKQDFSMQLPVKKPGVWPGVQRFDFVVRERPATIAEIVAARKPAGGMASTHKQSLFFALRELTGRDPGPTVEDWKKHFLNRDLSVKTLHTDFKAARALAVDGKGCAYVAVEGQIVRKEVNGDPSAWMKDEGETQALAFDGKGQLLAAHGKTGQVVRIDPASRELSVVAAKKDEKRFTLPRRLVADGKGGLYFADSPDATSRENSAVYYVSPHGSVTRLAVGPARPGGLGLSPDGKTLYIASALGPEVTAYPIESAGVVAKGRLLGKIASAGGKSGAAVDLAVDGEGLVYVVNAVARSVEVLTPEGAKAGSTKLPDAPVACTLGGEGNKTLFVLTGTALLAIEVKKAESVRTVSR